MITLSFQEAKDNLTEVLNEAAYGHKRFKITRHNKEMAIIISVDDWNEIEKMLQKLEDEDDISEAKIALKEVEKEGSIPFDEMKKRIGL